MGSSRIRGRRRPGGGWDELLAHGPEWLYNHVRGALERNRVQLYLQHADLRRRCSAGGCSIDRPERAGWHDEIKAAWIQLDDPSLWPSFKTSQAVVFYPSAPTTPVTATMGLV